jgi:hypothetical protein
MLCAGSGWGATRPTSARNHTARACCVRGSIKRGARFYQLLRDGQITDEARRHIERELDLEEASIARKEEATVGFGEGVGSFFIPSAGTGTPNAVN